MAYTKQTWLDRVGTFLNRFTKSNETLSSVELVNNPGTITQAGTAFSASRMNYMEAGIEEAHRIATPLSDLSRVMRINGDGVPMFPDNVAGRTYWKSGDWTTVDGWSLTRCTASFSNGKMIITATGNTPVISQSGVFTGKLVKTKIRLQSGVSTGLYMYDGLTNYFVNYSGNQSRVLNAGYCEIGFNNGVAGDVYEVDTIYIGSGLFDTPVYGKDGQTIATNHGVVPVNGPRGKGLLFHGAQYLESPDKLGTSGVIAFKYKKLLNGIYENVISNFNASDRSGCGFYIDADQVLRMVYGDGSLENSVSTNTGIVAGEDSDFVVNYTATTIGPVYRDGVQVLAQTNIPSTIKAPTSSITRIGCPLWSTSAQLLNGQLDDILVRSTPMTQDDAIRYHNGDDAVDSQQKAVTPTPHALMCRDNEGMTYQAYLTKTGSSTGLIGAMCFDASYLYICTAVNTWKRVALTTF